MNRGRQRELDFAKGLTILFMVLVHTTEYYSNGENIGFQRFVEFVGSPPGAPVFMALLGVGIVYSRHNSPRELAKRGLLLLAGSYVFNALVYALPYLLAYVCYGDKENLAYARTEFLDVDILQFAGLAFLFFAWVKKRNWTDGQVLGICAVLQIVNSVLLESVMIQNSVAASVLGLLWGTGEDSYFPFFSWIAFVVLGYLLGKRLMQCEDKRAFYGRLLLGGGVLYLAGYLAAARWGIDYGAFGALYQESFYHMDICGNLILASFVLFWFGCCYFVSEMLPEVIHQQMLRLSRNLTPMYCIQYVLIIYLQVFFLGEDMLFDSIGVGLLSAILFIATDILAELYQWFGTRYRKKQKIKNRTVSCAVSDIN